MSSSGAGGAAERNLYGQVIDALNAIFGSHPGYRPVDAKGIICEGTFRASAEAWVITRAPHIQGSQVPLIVRFSDFSGIPGVRDNDPRQSARDGYSLSTAGGTSTDIVAQSYNGFPAGTCRSFSLFSAPSAPAVPASKSPHPSMLSLQITLRPRFRRGAETDAAELRYRIILRGEHLQFVNGDGRRQPGRYRVVPIAGEHHLQPSEADNLPATTFSMSCCSGSRVTRSSSG